MQGEFTLTSHCRSSTFKKFSFNFPGDSQKVKGESMESNSSTLRSAKLQNVNTKYSILIQTLFTGFQPRIYTCIVKKINLT